MVNNVAYRETKLGLIPEHWEVKPLKELCNLLNGRAYKKDELLSEGKTPILRVGNFFTNHQWYYSDLELEESKYCDTGDLLYAWSASFGPKIWNGPKVIYHYHIWKLSLNENIDKKFLYYSLLADVNKLKRSLTGSTMVHISKENMEPRLFLVPPLKEQQKIAEILSSVDAAIEKTEQVIAKTEEVKKGLMQQLLTKGIGHTEFKQTEVGEIPVEWEVKSGEELFNIVSGYSPSAVTDLIEAGSILFLKVNDFNNNRMYIKQSALYFEEANNSKIKCYNPGTIIFPKRGAAIFTNKIAILSKKAAFDTNIMGLECNHLINNQFLYFYLKNYGLYNISDNSGVPQLNNKHINPLLIPVPSLNEQIKIVENIQCFEMKLEKELLYLEKLFKVKQGLMQQLLTGQVRVKID